MGFMGQMDYIFFLYGLSFILLVSICQFLNRRSAQRLAWGWLGIFGALHGLNEWLDLLAFSLGWGSDPALNLVRLLLLVSSFIPLIEFGRASMIAIRGQGPGRWVLAPLLGVAFLGGLAGFPGFFASARYSLGLVAGLWAAGALYLASRGPGPGKRALLGAALGMAGYALAAGLVVNPAPFFPASWLNGDTFSRGLGIPIQLVKASLAAWICVALFLFAKTTLLTEESDRRLWQWELNLLRGAGAWLIILVAAGWIFTQYLGENAVLELKSDQAHQGRLFSLSCMGRMAEADNLVIIMAGSPGIVPSLVTRDTQAIQQANSVLDRYSRISPHSVCYLMDLKGLTIASSNRHQPDSFVGKSYGFHPYFQEATRGSPGQYWALGVTSTELGYYASSPVRDHKGNIVAVAVIKRASKESEELFSEQSLGLIIDPRGGVVLANRPELQLKSLWPLSATAREEVLACRQFGEGPFPAILTQEPVDGAQCLFQGKSFLVRRQPFPWRDWAIVILSPMRPVVMARLMGISITLLLCLVLIGLTTIVGLNINATARIQRSERRYRELYETMRDGSVAVNLEGKIVESNLAFQNMLGYSAEEILQLTTQDVTPGKWHPLEAKIIAEQVLTRGYSDIYEKEYRCKDGSIFPAELQTYLVRDKEGNPTGIWSLIRNITVRKQAVESLRESEQKFRLLVKTVPAVVYRGYADWTVDFFDEKVEKLTGFAVEDFNSRRVKWSEVILAEDMERATEIFKQALRKNRSYVREYRIKERSGTIHWIRERGQIICAENSRIDYITGVYSDITKEHEMEVALERLRLQNEMILNSAGEGIVGFDLTGKVTFVNLAVVSLTGYEPKELLGHSFHLLVHHKKPDGAPYSEEECPIYHTIRDGKRRQVTEDLFWTKEGKPLPVEYVTTPIEEGGQLVGAVGVFRDITERKQAEEALHRSEEQLRQSQKMEAVGCLAGGVAHDFNNILTAIIGYVELLRLKFEYDDPHQKDLQEIQTAAERAASLTSQLLAFSRKQIFSPQVLNLNNLVMNLDKMLRRLISEDIELVTVPGAKLGMVMADPGQIEQVVINLVVNARDAMPQGGVITIETGNVILDAAYARSRLEVNPGPYVMVAVGDTGRGMDEVSQARIFEPFFTTKEMGKGTGLGLSTVHGIVKQSGGHISVYSEPGHGTTFKVYLPRLSQSEEKEAAAPSKCPLHRGSETILLVEDEDMVRHVARRLLEMNGYTVLEASSGHDALSVSQQTPGRIHLMLTDVVMPGISGGETAELLKAQRPEIKVLFMSGHTENSIVHHGVLNPGVAFLQKPFKHDLLVSKVREVLDGPPTPH